ncbi:MAG: hypothetical protein WKF59_10535 [Chitinophagaceae bacterium]
MRLSTLSFSFVLGTALALSSCEKEINSKNNEDGLTGSKAEKANQAAKYNTFYGPQEEVGEGPCTNLCNNQPFGGATGNRGDIYR